MPLLIGALVSALLTALRTYLPGIVGRILLTLGIGAAVKTIAIPSLIAIVQNWVFSLPAVLIAYVGALRIDICFTMILSAFAAKATQKLLLSKLG